MHFRILQQWQRVADHYDTDMTENPTMHSRRNALRAFNRSCYDRSRRDAVASPLNAVGAYRCLAKAIGVD